MMCLQYSSFAQIHVHAAGQAWVKAANRAHDIDALEFVGTVLLEDGRVLDRIFVRSWSSVDVAWIGIPRRRRIGMVVRNLSIPDDDMVRENAADRFVEAAA